MKILAIETSCDETAITALECSGGLPEPQFKILGNALHSQVEIHKEYGGVYPMLAKREHLKNLPIVLEKVLSESGLEPSEFDYIAVTEGPGLEPALWTGIEFAKALGEKWGKQVMGVNHMSGHLFSFLFNSTKSIAFPAVALLVSGGHTELVLMDSFDKYRLIGRTRDDAVGESFDKVARLLGMPYPGGPKISELAAIDRARSEEPKFVFPRPMLDSKDYDFSYSGLKTAVLYTVRKLGELDINTKESLARAFEEAAIEPLVEKTRRALEAFNAKTLIIGGGVAANTFLKKELTELAEEYSLDFRTPESALTTDNAVMIGVAAYVSILTNSVQVKEIVARGNLALS